MKRLLPVLLLLASGCPGFKYEAPRPPTWDDQCQPSDPYYLELAQGTQFMAEEGEIPSDPQEALDKALEYIESKGVDLEYKADGIEDWSKFNTTFPKTIYVTKDFDSKSIESQAGTLWHEIAHLREYEEMKPETFYQHYVFPEGRWALEVQAYRESFRVMRIFGFSESRIRSRMTVQAEGLYENYELDQMPKACAVDGAINLWATDIP